MTDQTDPAEWTALAETTDAADFTHTTEAGPADQETYFNGRSAGTGRFGPYAFPTRIRIRAYATFVRTGDDTQAGLRLRYNGDPAGEASDQQFDRANLQVLNFMVLDKGQKAEFAIETRRNDAVLRYSGMEAWLSLA